MKLEHSKSWYQKNSEIEDNSEIGAGAPPWTRTATRKLHKVSPVPEVGVVCVLARKTTKAPRARHVAHRAPRESCHA